jgi:hypothetical protein
MFEIYPEFKNKPIIPTKSAAEELWRYGLSLWDIKEVLEDGFDCATSKRMAGTFEICLIIGKMLRKAVVVEKDDKWLLIHVGLLRYSKMMKRRFRVI